LTFHHDRREKFALSYLWAALGSKDHLEIVICIAVWRSLIALEIVSVTVDSMSLELELLSVFFIDKVKNFTFTG